MLSAIKVVVILRGQPKPESPQDYWKGKLDRVRRRLARAYRLQIRAQREFNRITGRNLALRLETRFKAGGVECSCAWIRRPDLGNIDLILKAGRRLQAANDRVRRLQRQQQRYQMLYHQAKKQGAIQ